MHVSQATAGSKRAAGTLMDKTQTYIEYNGKTHTKDAIGGQSFAELFTQMHYSNMLTTNKQIIANNQVRIEFRSLPVLIS